MATVKKSVTAQTVLLGDFTFNIAADSMVAVSGVLTAFKATGSPAFDVMTLPPGHQVVGGDVTVATVSNDSGTATIAIGDDGSATRYLGATNIKAAARTALVPTGFRSTVSRPIRATIANQNGDATTGQVLLTVQFTVPETRASENLKTT